MRIIPKIDIKNDYVVKSINLEGVKKVGIPNELQNIIRMELMKLFYGCSGKFIWKKQFI